MHSSLVLNSIPVYLTMLRYACYRLPQTELLKPHEQLNHEGLGIMLKHRVRFAHIVFSSLFAVAPVTCDHVVELIMFPYSISPVLHNVATCISLRLLYRRLRTTRGILNRWTRAEQIQVTICYQAVST